MTLLAGPRTPNPFAHAASILRPKRIDVFDQLGYEPVCMPRVLAAREIGFYDPVEATKAGYGDQLPAPCGQCPQERFQAAVDEYAVFYGGAAGGGKTKGLLMFGLKIADRFPGIRILAVRNTNSDLEESFLAELAAIDYARAIGARWSGNGTGPTGRILRLKGSLIRFRYADKLQDLGRRQGGQNQLILVDEGGLMNPTVVNGLEERLRTGSIRIPVVGIRIAANPGGPSHGENKQRFIEPTDFGAHPAVDEQGRSVLFIPAKVSDNPYVNVDYIAQLDGIKDPARRAAMRDGDWSAFVGQVFQEWRHGRHVVPRPRGGLPTSWRRWAGIDYGRAAPWAVQWIAVDGDGRTWVYREEYEAGVDVADQATRIVEDEMQGEGVTHVIDPSTNAKHDEGLSIFEQYAVNGVGCLLANNDRIAGWAVVHAALSEGPLCPYHLSLKDQGQWEGDTCPMLHVLDGVAPNLVRTLPELPYDKTRIEDVDTHAEDHAADALRYVLMATHGSVSFP